MARSPEQEAEAFARSCTKAFKDPVALNRSLKQALPFQLQRPLNMAFRMLRNPVLKPAAFHKP